ncbi:MAG: hypothetical protein Crog4KO_21400 [Crocinitomicaceae bacterium]
MNVNHIQYSANHWANGGTFYDFNEDGWDDLVLPVENDSLVFYQNFNGNLVKIASYLFAPGQVRQITWIDYDDNGTLDLCVTYHDIGIRMYKNDGNFNFTNATSSLGISTAPFSAYGVSFADPDGDGDLDFYVCAYETVQVHGPNASNNLFYLNDNNTSYSEVGVSLGINNGAQPSFMPVWFDYDNDGDLDLHVINDREYAGDAFFENDNGTFTEVTTTVGLLNYGHNPMSISVSDFDNDGDFDIFESDVANGAISNGTPVDYKLFRNNNGVNFSNVASSVGIDSNFFAWGGLWVDYDNDCFEDLYMATSFTDAQVINERSSVFYYNNGGVNFSNQTDSVIGDLVCSSYCPVKGDLDNDGYYDIIVVNDGVPSHVFSNSGGTNNHIKITPKGSVSNKNAIGSRIEVFANGHHQTQMVFSGQGICAQNSQHKIFGIGGATIVDSVIITYPSGLVRKEYNLPANESYEILEQSTSIVQLTQTGNTLQVCAGDTIELSVPGYYNYEWSTGENQSSIEVTTSGYYSMTAENLVGDTVFVSNNLYVNFNQPLTYQENITNAPCGNNSFGSAEIIPAVTNLVDSVIWSDGTIGTLNDSLAIGTYGYTIVSIYGCIQQGNVSITAIPPFSTQYFTSPATDLGGGSVQVFVWGGTAPFVYELDGNIVSDNITDLNPGVYQLTITDALGCSQIIEFTIEDQTTASIENLQSSDFNIYVSNNTLFVCSDSQISKEDVAVYDVSGKNIINDSWNQDEAECVYHSSKLMNGLYVVKIQNNATVYSKKVLIH